MKVCGQLIEFNNKAYIEKNYYNDLYLRSGGKIYRVDRHSVKLFIERTAISSFRPVGDSLWLSDLHKNNGEKIYYNELINIKNGQALVKEKQGVPIANGSFYGEFCVYTERIKRKRRYALKNLKSGDIRYYDNNDLFSYSLDEKAIYFKADDGEIICVDYDINAIWERSFEKENYSFGNKPILFNDTIICNVGSDNWTRKYGQIVALNKETGEIVWEQIFEEDTSSCTLIEDKLYIASVGQMIVLDAATGDIIVNEPSGLKKTTVTEHLCSDGKRLFMVSPEEAVIKVFSLDGKTCEQEIKIPYPYTMDRNAKPVTNNGYTYMPVTMADQTLASVSFGLLALYPAQDGEEAKVQIQEWPVLDTVLTIEESPGSEFYHVIVTGDTIDDVLRYGEIKLKEVVSTRSRHMFSGSRQNKAFNGKILFSTNLDDFDEEKQYKINEMVERAQEHATTLNMTSADGKTDVKIELVPIPE